MKDGEGIAQNLFDQGKISPLTIRLISTEALCATYKKLPHEIYEMDQLYYDSFLAILRGRAKGIKNANTKK